MLIGRKEMGTTSMSWDQDLFNLIFDLKRWPLSGLCSE